MFVSSLLLSTLLSISAAPADTLRQEQLEEVVVKSNSARQRLRQIQTGAEQVQIKDLTASPQLFGEQDIMRSMQLLTGVKSESDASSSFQVRGGTSAAMHLYQPHSTRDCSQHSMAELHRQYLI